MVHMRRELQQSCRTVFKLIESSNPFAKLLFIFFYLSKSRISDQNGIPRLYIIVVRYHSGWKLLTFSVSSGPNLRIESYRFVSAALLLLLLLLNATNYAETGLRDIECKL